MKMNPFNLKPMPLEKCLLSFDKLYSKSYNKHEVDPYTKIRIILMNGTEFEACWYTHAFSRHCNNNNLRRELALMRRIEQQQQKRLSSLKPIDDTILETTIGYEQLAVDLTAGLAMNETDPYIKSALDFALLEDFDHLYRYADLLQMEHGIYAEKLVGCYTEIMPGRPTIAEHRHPFDDVKRTLTKDSDIISKLNANIVTAAEQQTMNFYMNVGANYTSDIGRKLYAEIAMIEEQHVTHYGSLLDPNATLLEGLLMHEYTECYLYYSMAKDEKDSYIKSIYESHFEMEVAMLHTAAQMLEKYENKHWQQVIPDGTFPKLFAFSGMQEKNKEYVRSVLTNTVFNTGYREDYKKVDALPRDYDFFKYNSTVNSKISTTASHSVIDDYISEFGEDYRFEEAPHPIQELSCRKEDNTQVARVKDPQ